MCNSIAICEHFDKIYTLTYDVQLLFVSSELLLKVNIIGYYLSKIVLEAVSWRFTPTG
jgi:hypothetical protein